MSTEDFNLYTKQRLGLLGPINANQFQYLDMMGNLHSFLKVIIAIISRITQADNQRNKTLNAQ